MDVAFEVLRLAKGLDTMGYTAPELRNVATMMVVQTNRGVTLFSTALFTMKVQTQMPMESYGHRISIMCPTEEGPPRLTLVPDDTMTGN